MSDIGRYRRAYPRLFPHPEFKKLAPLAQRLTTYLLFGPQSNRIGLASHRRARSPMALSFGELDRRSAR